MGWSGEVGEQHEDEEWREVVGDAGLGEKDEDEREEGLSSPQEFRGSR